MAQDNTRTVTLDKDVKPLLKRISFIIDEDLVETQPWVDGEWVPIEEALNEIDGLMEAAREGIGIIRKTSWWLDKQKKRK